MQRYKTKQINKYIPIIVIYFVVVAIRFLLALATSVYPTIGIDEFLYYSLARSIATKGELLFRGQPADYSYILYPLVLSPIYLVFKEGVNYYRLIQLWNIIIMSLSVFPVYGLSRLMLKNEKESLIVASLFMVLPDFILGQIIFSEAIIYPLFFALMYAAYCCIEKPRFKYLIYIGLLGGLLYSAKPGAVLPAVIFLVYVLAQTLINKNRRQVIATFAGMAVLCVVPLAFLVLAKYCFGYSGSGFSVYNSQIGTELGWHLEKFFKFLAIYPYYFLLSCGVVGVAYPITRYKRWNSVQKAFWWFIIVCIIGMIIGTCWTVNRYEYRTNRAHLRYVAMYIPLMLLFCLLPEMSREKSSKKEIKKNKMPIILLMLYIVGCTLIWGCKAGAESEIYPLMSLCILLDRFMPASAQWWGNVAVILLCAALFIWLTRAENKKQKQYSAMILVGIMSLNSIMGYVARRQDVDIAAMQEGQEAVDMIDGDEYVFLYTEEGAVDIGIDISSRHNNSAVSTNDFINHLYENGGQYVPFIPENVRGLIPDRPTADTNTLVLDSAAYSLFKFSPYVTIEATHPKNIVYVVHLTQGKRMVDSSIGNVKKWMLEPGTPGILLLYDEAYLQKPLTIRFEITSSIDQVLTVFSTHELYTINMNAGRGWYEVTFEHPEDAYNFTVDERVQLHNYELLI